MVRLAGYGCGPTEIGRRLGCSARCVRKWLARFRARPCEESLRDRPRSGRPAQVSVATRCQLVRLACSRPEGSKVPFREIWTQEALAQALEQETGVRLSRSEVGRILRFEKLRPHRVRYWLHSPDPDFGPKAARICDLYLDPPENTVVLCVDEKPIQVLGRKYPTHVGPNGVVRFEYEYIRRGTRALLGCFEVSTGRVVGQIVPRRTADALVAFMEQVAEHYPRKQVIVVWDNLNTHYDGPSRRWSEFSRRHGDRFDFVYTPVHASWMNQIEIWFSILERRVLRYGDFASAEHLTERVLGFIGHWNDVGAKPFRWTWRSDKREHAAKRAV